MKIITAAKPMVADLNGPAAIDPNLKAKKGGLKKQRVTVLNQTNGGMQPWTKTGAHDDDFDDGIFNRHQQALMQLTESERPDDSEHPNDSEQHPAEFDGGILLLDAEEAIHSIMDSESNQMNLSHVGHFQQTASSVVD